MSRPKLLHSVIIFLLLIFLICFVALRLSQKNALAVVFLDVGQGDAILISQGSKQILVDGGKDGKVLLEKLGKHIPFWDRTIETIIATHPDQDHIGGLIKAIEAYTVETVIETGLQSDSQTYKKWEGDIANEYAQKIIAQRGVSIDMGNGARLGVIYPSVAGEGEGSDNNASSVVVRLTFGKNSFLFTGDLPMESERALLELGEDLRSDVLKVSHHGSKYGTSDMFLERVKPKEAVISVGKNNSYGHPSEEVINRLLARRMTIFKTSEEGDIAYFCPSAEQQCQRRQ